jgi:hypothetical protein
MTYAYPTCENTAEANLLKIAAPAEQSTQH